MSEHVVSMYLQRKSGTRETRALQSVWAAPPCAPRSAPARALTAPGGRSPVRHRGRGAAAGGALRPRGEIVSRSFVFEVSMPQFGTHGLYSQSRVNESSQVIDGTSLT